MNKLLPQPEPVHLPQYWVSLFSVVNSLKQLPPDFRKCAKFDFHQVPPTPSLQRSPRAKFKRGLLLRGKERTQAEKRGRDGKEAGLHPPLLKSQICHYATHDTYPLYENNNAIISTDTTQTRNRYV